MRKSYPKILGLCLFFLISIFNTFSQNGVSINTSGTVPDNSAILDLSAETDKGMILPKVALVSTIVAGPVTLPATGILVWNTATAGVPPNDVTPGIYYNSGTPAAPVWARLATGAAATTDWNLDGNTNAALKSIGTNDNFDFPIETNGSEKMRVMTAGNVGIGTAAPNASALLDLTSPSRGFLLPRVALTATNLVGPIAAPAVGLMVYNTATAGVSPNNVTPGQYWWDGVKWVRYAAGNAGWEITGNTNTTASVAAIGAPVNNNFIGTTDAKDWVMATNNLERMRIDFSGKVGIGTIAPRGVFDVQPNADIYLVNDPIVGTSQSLLLPGFVFLAPFNGTNVSYLQARRSNSTGTTSLRLRTYNAGALTEAMHIEGNGNVGIGTITPNAPLQFANTIVNRKIVLWEGLNNDHQFYGFGISPSVLRYQTDASTADHVFYSGIGAVSSLELMRVKGNGQVGIGTATPDASALFDVFASNKGVIFPRVALVAANVAGPIVLPATGLMVYNTATAGAAPNNVLPGYYYNSGTPAAPIWKRFSTGNADAWTLLGNAGTIAATNYIGTSDAIDFVTRTNNVERMRVLSTGNVGVGTNTPALKLSVKGDDDMLMLEETAANSVGTGSIILFQGRTAALSVRNSRIGLVPQDAGFPYRTGALEFRPDLRTNFYRGNNVTVATDLALTILGATGHVGIGINAPVERLHVSDAASPNNTTVRISGLANTSTLVTNATDVMVMSDVNGTLRRSNETVKDAWYTTGNAVTAVRNFGTTTNFAFQFIANNIVRGRVNPADGEFVWGGAAASPYVGDALCAVGTVALPFAVNGYSAQNGSGTWGEILVGSATAFSAVQGVYGGSGVGAGVMGNYNGTNTSNVRAGTMGVLSTPTATVGGAGVYGYSAIGTIASNQHMGVLGNYNGASYGIGVYGIGFGGGLIAGNFDIAVVGWRGNNANYSGYFNGNHVIANGTKTASVGTSKGNQLLYVMESPEVWFEDFGTAKLVNGEAEVQLDPLFLETVLIDDAHPMHVFVQVQGECNDVYVVPGTTSFKVKEKENGQTNVRFSYRLVAKRLSFPDHRFGNDPVWGAGDTREYMTISPKRPVDYDEMIKQDEEDKKNWKPTKMPAGFVDYFQIQKQTNDKIIERTNSTSAIQKR